MANITIEPVVVIDKRKNKEAHIVIPVNNSFEDLLHAAKRINTGLFEGEWELSYMDPETKKPVPIDKEDEIGDYTKKDINTFFWNYKTSTFKSAFEKRVREAKEAQRKRAEQQQHETQAQQDRQQEKQVLGLVYSNISTRFFAWLIDLMIIGFISGITGLSGGAMSFLYIFYFALMESSNYQASLGKIALGLRVTDMRGNTLSFTAAVWRNFLKSIAHAVIFTSNPIFFILFAPIFYTLFNTKHQAIHDQWAKSVVLAEVDKTTRY